MRFKIALFYIAAFISFTEALSQPCTTLGQTPSTAFPVCGISTFVQNTVPICGGTPIPTSCTGGGYADVNPFWYRFTCFVTGTLGFVIDPINNNDDYDWVLFDITGRNPGDVFADISLNVAENWSANPGNTGASNNTNGLRNCAGGFPNFSSMPTITAGREYLLMVSNWSASQQGYTLTFGGGTAGITDPLAPAMASAGSDCGGQQVTVRFNKEMKCNSLSLNGSEFSISPAGGAIASAGGYGCLASFDMDSAYIRFNNPLPPGNYTLTINNGTDGNTLLDNCGTGIATGNSIPFTVPARPPLPMGTVTGWPASDCQPIQMRILFPVAVMCASAALDGSDFIVTGPAPVTVSAVIPVCTTGETNGFTIQFTAPLTVPGTYTVQLATGSDGNTIVDRCNSEVPPGSTAQFTVAGQSPIPMGTVTIDQCAPNSMTLTFADPIHCNSIAVNGSDFSVTGASPVTVISATPVNCTNGEANTINLQFSSPIVVAGSYQVAAATGTDANTITGQCRQVPVGASAAFSLAPVALVAPSVALPCAMPSFIDIVFAASHPANCSSLAADGSDFVITGPSPVSIVSAGVVSCTGGEATGVVLQLASPIDVPGTYSVAFANGSDGNTVSSICGQQFSAGAFRQFDIVAQPPIPMGTVAPPNCTPQTITLNFTDSILCNSIAADGSDFSVSGPGPVTVASASAASCTNGLATAITLQFLSPALVPGVYTVTVNNGSDGNSLFGRCNKVNAGANTTFAVPIQPPLPMGNAIQPADCAPTSIKIEFPESFDCTSISANGSEFLVTGPSAVSVIGAGGQCNINPNDRTITIQFAGPVIVSGAYRVEIRTGTDGNTIRGDCNRYLSVGDFTTFTVPDAPPALMDSIAAPGCAPTSLRLFLTDSIVCSSVAFDGSDFAITGNTPVTILSATGACNAMGLINEIVLQLASPVQSGGIYTLQLTAGTDGNTLLSKCFRQTPLSSLNFSLSDTVSAEFQYSIQYDCETDLISFSHDGRQNVNQWSWTVNGTQASTAQSFDHSFSSTSQNQVQLTVSNGICSDSHTETINLNNKASADFIAPSDACPEDTARFIDNSQGQIDNWQWTFGNGNTSSLSAPPAQLYPLTGVETFYPVSLTVSNSFGCSTTATKMVKVLGTCLIAVPSAFTPNGDGKNDFLYPLNALKAENLDFRVFNRWGQLVFQSRDWTKKWDGRVNGHQQGTGVYIWTLNFTHRDTRVKYSLKGTTTLIR